eukprot:1337804-Amorphochlora_amoeboformis.AAC.2
MTGIELERREYERIRENEGARERARAERARAERARAERGEREKRDEERRKSYSEMRRREGESE